MKKSAVVSLALLNGFLVACGQPQTKKDCDPYINVCKEEKTNTSSGGHSTFVHVIVGARPYSGTISSSPTSTSSSSFSSPSKSSPSNFSSTSTARGGFGSSASSHVSASS